MSHRRMGRSRDAIQSGANRRNGRESGGPPHGGVVPQESAGGYGRKETTGGARTTCWGTATATSQYQYCRGGRKERKEQLGRFPASAQRSSVERTLIVLAASKVL